MKRGEGPALVHDLVKTLNIQPISTSRFYSLGPSAPLRTKPVLSAVNNDSRSSNRDSNVGNTYASPNKRLKRKAPEAPTSADDLEFSMAGT